MLMQRCRYQVGKKVVAYEERAESVSAIFDDGEKIKADILVGFDGIHSTVRNMMLQKEIEKSISVWERGDFISSFLITNLRIRH